MKAFNPSKELKPKKYKKLKIAIPIIIAVVLSVMIGRSLANYSVHYELQVINSVVGEFSKGVPAVEVVEGITNPNQVAKDDPDNNLRYIGANPDNYVTFNGETWRIIGVFNTYVCDASATGVLNNYKSNSACEQEKLLKIIKNNFLSTSMAWDTNNVNDWSTATLQKTLNGEYLEKNGSYSSNGLNDTAQSMVANVVWTLGGSPRYDSASTGLTSHFYRYERWETVYSGRPKAFVGKVGLMYLSDYGYATGGGSTYNRAACLAKEIYNWSKYQNDCTGGSWLFNTSYNQWTLSPYSVYPSYVLYVRRPDYVNYDCSIHANSTYGVRPVVYLKSSVQIAEDGMDGSSTKPYNLSL